VALGFARLGALRIRPASIFPATSADVSFTDDIVPPKNVRSLPSSDSHDNVLIDTTSAYSVPPSATDHGTVGPATGYVFPFPIAPLYKLAESSLYA
jgi:hypothetical protein